MRHPTSLNLDEQLFEKIKYVYDNRDKQKLTPVQKRVVEKYYKKFQEQGAALPAEKKAQLIKVNDELSKCSSSSIIRIF